MPSSIANSFIKSILRSPLHPLLGRSFAVISVQGVKSGKTYSTPINVARLDSGFLVVSYRHRTWWRNLRGGRPAQLTVGGRTFSVTGIVMEETAEVVRGLVEYFLRYPGYAKYFNVRLAADGRPVDADLEIAASQRVIIRLTTDHGSPVTDH